MSADIRSKNPVEMAHDLGLFLLGWCGVLAATGLYLVLLAGWW
jgi:hypothetical protein